MKKNIKNDNKIKWLYKIPLITAATAIVAPMIVSCSVEKPKVETQEEKEKRLEHQRALQIAPNLTKFIKEYNDKLEKGNAEFVVKNIKQLKEHTSNINHLNDFEKSYLGLYDDIQNFFDNSIHRYTPENLSFEYFENVNDDSDTKQYPSFLILEENTLTQEQMFYHKIYQVLKKYDNISINLEVGTTYNGKFTKITEILEQELSPIINEKIEKFSKNHKEFQFKNLKLNFKYGKNGEFAKNIKIIIEVSVEVEYQNQKLPKELIVPLTFDVDIKTTTKKSIHLEEYIKELEQVHKESTKKTMKKVKTLAEMENILKSKDNDFNRDQLKEIKKRYSTTLKIIEDIEDNKDNEEVEM